MPQEGKDELLKLLSEGIENVRNSDGFKKHLAALSYFHDYSAKNTILIYSQKPNATNVAGYETWKSLNRQVRYGEKGISIFKPVMTKLKVYTTDEKTGKKVENEETKIKFRPTTIFDISQTDGEPLPPNPVNELTGVIEHLEDLFSAIGKISNTAVCFKVFDDNTKGEYIPRKNQINLKIGMSDEQTIKTYLHEIAHSLMHHNSVVVSREFEELQAESVAFAVARHFNIDTSSYSFPYLTSWAQQAEIDEIRQALTSIQETVHGMIDSMEKSLNEIQHGKNLTVSEKSNNLLSEKLKAAQLKTNQNFSKSEVTRNEQLPNQF